MTKERLMSFSQKILKEIAQKENISFDEKIGKEDLINLIFDALEEDQLEKRISNNSAINIEEKKYDILKDDEIEPLNSEDYVLPDRYNDTEIVMLLRDPLWAYAYWDIDNKTFFSLKGNILCLGLTLRIHEMSEPKLEKATIVSTIDIPVKLQDNRWYLNLPRRGSSYCIELLSRFETSEELLCTSNIITSPKGGIQFGEEKDPVIESIRNFFDLYSFYDSWKPKELEKIPQRIISLMDTKYLR